MDFLLPGRSAGGLADMQRACVLAPEGRGNALLAFEAGPADMFALLAEAGRVVCAIWWVLTVMNRRPSERLRVWWKMGRRTSSDLRQRNTIAALRQIDSLHLHLAVCMHRCLVDLRPHCFRS